MRLEGIHHVTAITGDAPRNVDFYARVLGLRLVKKTVNCDAPDVYHLYYGDELGRPGSVLTFFEYPGARPGRAGAGMVHRVAWRVAGAAALDFWAGRLAAEGVHARRAGESLRFAGPEGLALELVAGTAGEPLRAASPGIPPEHALLGFAGARAYTAAPGMSGRLLTATLGFAAEGRERYSLGAASWAYDPPPPEPPVQGAGTVHHVAFTCRNADHAAWHEAIAGAGLRSSPIMDRTYFRSIYFREPSGVLFELATAGPGFAVDEAPERLGEELRLPPQYEELRAELERRLTPLPHPPR